MRRRSTIAFLMTLPLIALIVGLVAYPTGFAIYLSMLDRRTITFVGLDNFAYLLGRDSFWRVVYQTCLFAIVAALLKAILGFCHGPARAHHPSQGTAQVARHAPGALGHSARHGHAGLAAAV